MKNATVLFLISFLVFIISCSEDELINDNKVKNSSVGGKLKFLDGSAAPSAKIELKVNSSGFVINDTCDVEGNFMFDSLYEGSYTITFRSLNYDINSSSVTVQLSPNQNIIQDIFIKYNMLDEFVSKIYNQDVFFIKMHPDGAKIGNNISMVSSFNGYYTSSGSDNISLSADVYLVPALMDWQNPGVDLTADYIRNNFQYLFSVNEEPVTNRRHQVKFIESNIQQLLSNPSSGFAFIRKDTLANEIKIPCVDFSNNDFGLKIFYK